MDTDSSECSKVETLHLTSPRHSRTQSCWAVTHGAISSCRQGSVFCCSRSSIQRHLATCTQWVGFGTMCCSWMNRVSLFLLTMAGILLFLRPGVRLCSSWQNKSFQPVSPALWGCPGPWASHVLQCLRAGMPVLDKLLSTWNTTAYAFWADLLSLWQDSQTPKSKDSFPWPSFKEA